MIKRTAYKLALEYSENNGDGKSNLSISNLMLYYFLKRGYLYYNASKGFEMKIEIGMKPKTNKIDEMFVEKEIKIYFLSKRFFSKFENHLLKKGISEFHLHAIKHSSISLIYFKNDIMNYFTSNPKYNFVWRGYRGNVYTKEEYDGDLYLRDLCLAYDLSSKEPIVALLVKDIIGNNDVDFLNYLSRYRIKDTSNLEINLYNRKNLFLGHWLNHDEIDIYSLLIKGMHIINSVFHQKYNFDFFLELYTLDKATYFRPIFYPTKRNYKEFISSTYKLLNQNIKKSILKKLIKELAKTDNEYYNLIHNKYNISNNERFDRLNEKGYKSLLDMYVMKYDNYTSHFKEFLESVDADRNTEAHEFTTDEYNEKLWYKQDEILKNFYIFLNQLIVGEKLSPLPHEYKDYSNIYGEGKGVNVWNGFNKPGFRIFDGQLRLINEKFGERDAEFLISFKDGVEKKNILFEHIRSVRKDIDEKIISKAVDIILTNVNFVANEAQIISFFKGYMYKMKFYGEFDGDYIEEGRTMATDFLSRYDLKNCYVFADSTDPYYSSLDEILTNEVICTGILCDIIHDFHSADYEFDNVVTNASHDSMVQVLSNIWD